MKFFYALLLLQIMCGGVTAQEPCFKNVFCGLNFNNRIPGLTIATTYPDNPIAYGKASVKFKDVQYDENCCTTGCGYNCNSDIGVLKYHVYYPSNYPNYNTCPLPAVILFHGGAFNECGDFTNPNVRTLAEELAYRGFVVFIVNYRRGVIPDGNSVTGSLPQVDYTSAQQLLAIYRACQDARGAIRSIIKREQDGLNTNYRINVNELIIGGLSAGSLIAMNSVYCQQPLMVNAVFGTRIQTDDGTANSVLGPINADYYYGTPDVEYFSRVKCVLNLWGGMFIPKSLISNISGFLSLNTYLPPIISFQGVNDDVFRIEQQGVYYSVGLSGVTDVVKENRCLIGTNYFSPRQLATGSEDELDLYLIGAKNIYNSFKSLSVFTEVYFDCQMEHGLDCGGCTGDANNYTKDKLCNACVFASDFGTGLTTQEAVLAYIAGRGATFYQAMLGSITSSLSKSEFIECPNNRFGCSNISDNPANCTNASCLDNN